MSNSSLVRIEVIRGVTVVSITKPGFSVTEDVMDQVSHLLLGDSLGDDSPVLMDLTNVEFFGSSFIEVMFRIWNKRKSKGEHAFGICGLTVDCRQILEVTNLTSVWDVYDTREEALKTMSPDA